MKEYKEINRKRFEYNILNFGKWYIDVEETEDNRCGLIWEFFLNKDNSGYTQFIGAGVKNYIDGSIADGTLENALANIEEKLMEHIFTYNRREAKAYHDTCKELCKSGACCGSCDCCDAYDAYEDEDDFDEEYIPSSERGDYSPSNPWDAPGMSIHDFI